VGQQDTIDLLLTALFARGHVLLEGPPGVAKTYLAQSSPARWAWSSGASSSRPT
jgi:MoxR-like ATPase